MFARMPRYAPAASGIRSESRIPVTGRNGSLVTFGPSPADGRVTEVALTGQGRQALAEAAPGHVDLVRRLFFEGLPEGLVGPLGEALESVYANIIKQGSLPPPVDWHPMED